MNTRETLISRGKIWIVYPDGKHKDKDILFEGPKTRCLGFIKEKFGFRAYKRGEICLAKVIWEESPEDTELKDQNGQQILTGQIVELP